ncbi:MAG TPA: hypothetical protein VKQ10_02095 [Spirochaetota bacterium]|nr:hypothetical protein [Spirochaetota bacterium]
MTEKKKITGIIQSYSTRARDKIFNLGATIFTEAGLSAYVDDIFACADELIKNAVKANYKFLLIKDALYRQFTQQYQEKSHQEIEDYLDNLLKDKTQFDTLADIIRKKEDISARVREILNQENKFLTTKNKAYRDGHKLSSQDLNSIEGIEEFQAIRQQMIDENIRIILKMQYEPDFIYIEVTNTAPILTHDLNRIHQKRDEYRHYRDEGKEYEFFINNIDTSDSGFGLGYAKIDSFLSNLGLNPDTSVTIISSNNTTALLTVPIASLHKEQIA